jgi:hypothetical protein
VEKPGIVFARYVRAVKKFQAPNSKLQGNFKFQDLGTPSYGLRLKFGF